MRMTSLWGDGWFYLSGGGFLISSLLFVFLLGQYRAAIEAEEGDEGAEPEPQASAAAEKIYIPRPIEPISSPKLSIVEPVAVLRKAAPVPSPSPSPALGPDAETASEKPAPEKKKSENSTGGLSPAVVYLQNLKGQIEHLDKEMGQLKGLASQQAAQGDLILKRLADLAQRLAQVEAAPRATADAAPAPEVPEAAAPPAIEPAQAVQADPEPAPAVETPEPAPAAQPVVSQTQPAEELKTITLEPPPQEPAPEPAAPEPEAKPARKGPVWPI